MATSIQLLFSQREISFAYVAAQLPALGGPLPRARPSKADALPILEMHDPRTAICSNVVLSLTYAVRAAGVERRSPDSIGLAQIFFTKATLNKCRQKASLG